MNNSQTLSFLLLCRKFQKEELKIVWYSDLDISVFLVEDAFIWWMGKKFNVKGNHLGEFCEVLSYCRVSFVYHW